jgi:hypothetical protein
MLGSVLKDALITHGHPHGFCGAIFHALCLAHALEHGAIPTPSDWLKFVDQLDVIPELIGMDPQLAAFWQTAWENETGKSLPSAVWQMQEEARADIEMATSELTHDVTASYRAVLHKTGCLEPRFRGSGFKTALAAVVLSWIYRDRPIEDALVAAANELESDTDTIATMAGAISGCVCRDEPDWSIQDRSYIVEEARRLAEIAAGIPQTSFAYPDLGHWSPPTKQSASVALSGSGFALLGLGPLREVGPEYSAGDAVWQWFSLPFGQTILVKRKADLKTKVALNQLPSDRQAAAKSVNRGGGRAAQTNLPFDDGPSQHPQRHQPAPNQQVQGLDYWTDLVIRHDFDDITLGQILNRVIDESRSIDAAIAFTAIIAKAKLARERRRRA